MDIDTQDPRPIAQHTMTPLEYDVVEAGCVVEKARRFADSSMRANPQGMSAAAYERLFRHYCNFPEEMEEYEVIRSKDSMDDDEYRVEAIDYDGEGQVYVAIFTGPAAKQRAEEYAGLENATSWQKPR